MDACSRLSFGTAAAAASAPIPFDSGRTTSITASARPNLLRVLTHAKAAGSSLWPQGSNFEGDSVDTQLCNRNRLFILGIGYVAQFFAGQMKDQGWVVSGTCKSVKKKELLEEKGFDVHVLDANEPRLAVLDIMKDYTHLLVSIPPMKTIGDPMLQHKELLGSWLRDGNLQWLCYLSSTSVYGDCGGAWVDEDCPANPSSETAKLRLLAEEGWLDMGHYLGISSLVFRLGGIYGPGRSALDTILSNKPLSKGQKMRLSRLYTSRVHVDDICQALRASMHVASLSKIYNVVDDDPAHREDVFKYAEDLVKERFPGCFQEKKPPDQAESMTGNLSQSNEKRVLNTRLKRELGVRLLHPNYKSGLLSIMEQMDIHPTYSAR